MAFENIFNIAGSAMSSQLTRLNTTASNMSNANTISGSEETAYRAKAPVFKTVLDQEQNVRGVEVSELIESQKEINKRYQPGHPMANDQGYIFESNVNVMEEMANMISASRSYQNNVEVMNTAKKLMLQTLNIGK